MISWRLICEIVEGDGVWIEKRGREPKWLMLRPWSRIKILCIISTKTMLALIRKQLVMLKVPFYQASRKQFAGSALFRTPICACL